jgi:hypothetical protein
MGPCHPIGKTFGLFIAIVLFISPGARGQSGEWQPFHITAVKRNGDAIGITGWRGEIKYNLAATMKEPGLSTCSDFHPGREYSSRVLAKMIVLLSEERAANGSQYGCPFEIREEQLKKNND